MGRTVIADHTHVEAFLDHQLDAGVTLQIGLSIGRLGSGAGRDAVIAVLPTPPIDGRDVAVLQGDPSSSRDGDKKKGSKTKISSPQSLQIDIDWVAEHARQVSKMLVGGIKVVGIYILANEVIFKSSTALLWQVAKVVATTVNPSTPDEFLLVNFSFGPRRVSCRSCNFASSFSTSSLHPCDWKPGKTLSLYTISSTYNFESRVPIYSNAASRRRLYDILLSAISLEETRLKSAIVLTDGSVVTDDKALVGETNHEMEIFLPFGIHEDFSSGEVIGLAILSGSVQARSYCFARDSLSHAVIDLQADIVNSLRSRLEILCDEIDFSSMDKSATDAEALHPLQRICEDTTEYKCKLPRRVFIPWLDGVILCDYMQEYETIQDIRARCRELFAMDNLTDESMIVECEYVSADLRNNTFWEVSSRNASPMAKSTKVVLNEQVTDIPSFNSLQRTLPLFVVFVAILVAYILTMAFRHRKTTVT